MKAELTKLKAAKEEFVRAAQLMIVMWSIYGIETEASENEETQEAQDENSPPVSGDQA